MEDKNSTADIDDRGVPKIEGQTDLIVHAIRILLKLGMVWALSIGHSSFFVPLTIYIFLSEVIDQVSLWMRKANPQSAKLVNIIYVLNSVSLISVVCYFANWALNDFYLIYLIHISSSTLVYGTRTGLLSAFLSSLSYSLILYLNYAPLEVYIRLPLLAIIATRMFISERKYEKTDQILTHVINIEKSKRDFITIASHNLRTPVAAIYGYIDLLLRGQTGPLSDQQTLFVQRIKNNNQELEKLTEQLLQISILEVNKEVNLLKQPTQIEVMVEDIVENFAPVARAKGLTLTFDKKNGLLPLIDIDVEKVKGVILNLVDNAIKYTEKGGIVISTEQKENYVEISVKDTGIGIAPDELPKIFTKFYRSGNLTVYNKTGTGLGLYIGKQIIDQHNGNISVASNPGTGTVFTITLPIIREETLV